VTDMRELIREKTDLAVTYAEDGAYISAARTLEDLAKQVRAHADRVYAELDVMAQKKRKRRAR